MTKLIVAFVDFARAPNKYPQFHDQRCLHSLHFPSQSPVGYLRLGFSGYIVILYIDTLKKNG